MGFGIGDIGDFFSDPVRAVAAATTLGGSEIARAVGGTAGQAAGAAINPVGALTNRAAGIGGGGVGTRPTPLPQGPATQPDLTNFSKFRTSSDPAAPQGVSFGAGTSPLQQRSQIATGATNMGGAYVTPEVSRYYRDLAIRSLTDEGGSPVGSVLPIERQFLEQVFGIRPRNDTTSSFLSALLRADGGYTTQTGLFANRPQVAGGFMANTPSSGLAQRFT